MRTLLVCREGAPRFTEVTAGPIREHLLGIEGLDDPMLYQIWEVHSLERGQRAQDITKRFASAWGREIEFGEGVRPEDYLSPFPEFVRSWCEQGLRQRWARENASRAKVIAEVDFIPPALRRIA